MGPIGWSIIGREDMAHPMVKEIKAPERRDPRFSQAIKPQERTKIDQGGYAIGDHPMRLSHRRFSHET